MTNLLENLFWISVVCIFHTYLFYPAMMILFYSKSKGNRIQFSSTEDLPKIAVLIAAFNEEKVIKEKILSVLDTNYPKEKLKIFVGSDASTDRTDAIVEELCLQNKNLQLIKFPGRVGKISIVNQLQSYCDDEILVMTDANVIFSNSTLFELVKFFKNEEVGIVAANIKKQTKSDVGISIQEKFYLSLENKVKQSESNAFDFIMGAEGGCYAIRNNLFSKVPSKFNVDDFYMTFQVILKGKKVLFNSNALCNEDVSGDAEGEYIRKVRISSGNFQNLFFFKGIAIRFLTKFGFAFFSHKVLRWFTPIFILIAFFSSLFLMKENFVFEIIFYAQLLAILFSFINYYLKIKNPLANYISHFYYMNLALLHGLIKFTQGIKSSIWQPVQRDV